MYLEDTSKKSNNKTVVRLRTSYFSTKHGIRKAIDLNVLKRKSTGWDVLNEEVSAMSVEHTFGRITNLTDCKDGIYLVEMTKVSTDPETGIVDDYYLKLAPYKEDVQQ